MRRKKLEVTDHENTDDTSSAAREHEFLIQLYNKHSPSVILASGAADGCREPPTVPTNRQGSTGTPGYRDRPQEKVRQFVVLRCFPLWLSLSRLEDFLLAISQR